MEVEIRVQCCNHRVRVNEQWMQAGPRKEEWLSKYITPESLQKECALQTRRFELSETRVSGL